MSDRSRSLADLRIGDIVTIEHVGGERAFRRRLMELGLVPGTRVELVAVAPGIVLVNLPGHTRGHAAVAVDAGDHWVLHVGDAFYHRGQINGADRVPTMLTLLERAMAHDWPRVRANHRRLAEVWDAAESGYVLVNAHDPVLLRHAQTRQCRS